MHGLLGTRPLVNLSPSRVINPEKEKLPSCPAASKEDRTGELTADGPGSEDESHSSREGFEDDSEEEDGMTVSRKAKQAAGRLHLG